MPSNREISTLFTLYAELLLLHHEDERLAALLSGAAYRLRNMAQRVTSLTKVALSDNFKPEIINIILELKITSSTSDILKL